VLELSLSQMVVLNTSSKAGIAENRGRAILDGVKGIELANGIDWGRMRTQITTAATDPHYECG